MNRFSFFGKTASFLAAAAVAALFMSIGCSTDDDAPGKSATASLVSTGGDPSGARGTVTFTQATGGVHVMGTFSGLVPGAHGFHVHDKGSCDSLGNAAGGHFNPAGTVHGLPDSAVHHMGDLGNLTAAADSTASVDKVVPYLTLEGANTIVGHALIIHALPDNGSQPTGAAGARVSCAVIAAGK